MKTDKFLTPRQREIVLYLAQGYSVDEISDKMHIIRQGVYNHLQRTYDELGIRRTVQAIVGWWYQVNFDLPDIKGLAKDTKGITAALLLILTFPSEVLSIHDTYRTVRRGKEIETVCRRGRGREWADSSRISINIS